MHTNWDDLRFILHVAKHGSVAGAARALQVNHSTVLRRVNAYEQARGARLFDRRSSGYTLTVAGTELVRLLSGIDDKLAELERIVAGHDLKLEGRVRITTTDSLSFAVLSPYLATFKAEFPLIKPELSVNNGHLDLSRRDADITVRPCREPPDGLVGERVASLGFHFYANADYLARTGVRPLEQYAWLGIGPSMQGSPPGQWVRDHVPESSIIFSADSFVALGGAAAAGMGVALLPCCLQPVMPELVALDLPRPEIDMGVWVLSHRDLQGSALVRACVDHLIDGLRNDAALLAGAS